MAPSAAGVPPQSSCRVMTMFVRPGRGRYLSGKDSQVLRPMITGWPVVSRVKCFMSSGRRHGMPPSLPMTPVLVWAQTTPSPVRAASVVGEVGGLSALRVVVAHTAIGALIVGWCWYPTTSKSSRV